MPNRKSSQARAAIFLLACLIAIVAYWRVQPRDDQSSLPTDPVAETTPSTPPKPRQHQRKRRR